MSIDMLFAAILLSLALGIPAYYVMWLRHHGQIAWQNTALQMGFLPVSHDKALETTIDRFNHRGGYHIVFDRTVGHTGPFEIIEHVLFAAMLVTAFLVSRTGSSHG